MSENSTEHGERRQEELAGLLDRGQGQPAVAAALHAYRAYAPFAPQPSVVQSATTYSTGTNR